LTDNKLRCTTKPKRNVGFRGCRKWIARN